MSSSLPIAAGDPNVMLAAIAKAAAEIAAQNACQRINGEQLGRDDVEDISKEAIREVFKSLGIDLTDLKSIEEFRESMAHARRARRWLEKAGSTALAGVVTAVVGFVIAAMAKYAVSGGLGK